VHRLGPREQRGGVVLGGQLDQHGQRPRIPLHWIRGRIAGPARYRRQRAGVIHGWVR
jgi:hypothetical protein